MSVRRTLLTTGPTGAFVEAILACKANDYLDFTTMNWGNKCEPLFKRLVAAGTVHCRLAPRRGRPGFPWQPVVLSDRGRAAYFGDGSTLWRFVTCCRREYNRERPHPLYTLQYQADLDLPPAGVAMTPALGAWLRRLTSLYRRGKAGAAVDYANLFVTGRHGLIVGAQDRGQEDVYRPVDAEWLEGVSADVCTVNHVKDPAAPGGYRVVASQPDGVRYVIVLLDRHRPPLAGVRRDHASVVVPLAEVLDEPDLVDAKLDVLGIF